MRDRRAGSIFLIVPCFFHMVAVNLSAAEQQVVSEARKGEIGWNACFNRVVEQS